MDQPIDHCYFTKFTVNDLPSDNAKYIYSWWRTIADANGEIPSRSSFKPFDHPKCLPNIVLHDIEYNPFRVKERVVGTKVVDMSGINTTGQYIDEQRGYERRHVRILSLVKTKEPYLIKNEEMRWASKDYSHYTNLALPLSDDGQIVTQVLHYMDFIKV